MCYERDLFVGGIANFSRCSRKYSLHLCIYTSIICIYIYTLYIHICMPAHCKVLIWCIHNENPFKHNLWWLHCGFAKEIQILNSSMEKHNVTHFRYLIDTLPTKPSLFFSSTPPSNVCPLCPFVFVAPLRYPAPPGKEAFQLYSVSKVILKL